MGKITEYPIATNIGDDDTIFINYQGQLRQIKKSDLLIKELTGTETDPIILSNLENGASYVMKGYVAYDTAHKANKQRLYSAYEKFLVTIRKETSYINIVGDFGTLTANSDGTFNTSYFAKNLEIATRTGIDYYSNIVLENDISNIAWCSGIYVYNSVKRKASDVEPDSHYGDGCYLYPMSNPDTATTYNFLVIPNGYSNKADKPFLATYTPANTVDVSADTYPWDSVTNIPNVNPVAKTETMTQPVGVDEFGGLFTEPSSGGEISEKEWTLFQTIEFDGSISSYEFTDIDFTEFYLEGIGLVNKSETSDSAIIIYIYDDKGEYIRLNSLATQKNSNPSSTKHQRQYIYHNGLYWDYIKLGQSMNKDYTGTDSSIIFIPYAVLKEIGKCKKLIVTVTNTGAYIVISGTLKIYAR